MTAREDLWTATAANELAVSRGLRQIEDAARGCGVFRRRWCGLDGAQAIEVSLRSRPWLVYPDPQDRGWVAAPRRDDDEAGFDQALLLGFTRDEGRVPSTAWGMLLAGCAELVNPEDWRPPAPAPTASSTPRVRRHVASRYAARLH